MTGEPYLGDIFHVPLSRSERRRREASFPKCGCGATIGKDRSEEGATCCRRCQELIDQVEQKKQAREDLLERALGATTIDELREVVVDIIERLPK